MFLFAFFSFWEEMQNRGGREMLYRDGETVQHCEWGEVWDGEQEGVWHGQWGEVQHGPGEEAGAAVQHGQ